ncbi:hypothetical protein DSECCO2_541010 [anaerobic digester metagenome]
MKAAEHGPRRLDQVGHLIQQGLGPFHGPARFRGQTVAVGADGRLAVGGVEDHPALLKQDAGVVVGVGHGEGAGTHDSVAARLGSGREAREPEGHGPIVQHGQEPAHGAAESAVLADPLHFLREGQGRQHGRARLGQDVGRVAAADGLLQGQVLALVRLLHVDLIELDVLGLGEAQPGLGRLAVGVEGDAHGRARNDDLLGLLHFGQSRDVHHQTPGRGKGGHGAKSEPGLAEQGLEAFAQFAVQQRQEARRHLLHPDLKNEMTHEKTPYAKPVKGKVRISEAGAPWPRAVRRTAWPRPRPGPGPGRCTWPAR